ncbi:MAG: HEAT repeat domain-containing protein, partial [Planctomycetes bacterium]|nr:HEAT repeat domain-containing protein [Planctomycetota bacterium]
MPPRGRSTATLAALLGLGVLLALVVAERETLLREVWILELRSAAPERALDLAKRLHGLGPRGRKAAEDWSAAHLASGAELLRLEAAELFVELSPLRAVPVLIQAFADEPQRSLASRWFPLLEKAVKADRAQAVPHLAAALGSADWHVRQSLVFLLERAGSAARTAAPRIAGLLGDTSADVRAAAASALRRVGAGPECVAPLRAALGDADWLVRLYAVEPVGVAE